MHLTRLKLPFAAAATTLHQCYRRALRIVGLMTFVLCTAPPASAALILSVDVDPLTAGIQSNIVVPFGSSLDVDIFIDGVESASPLNAFQFDLDFIAAVLDATAVVDGGFVPAPSTILNPDLTPPDVNFAVFNLTGIGNSGSGVLATISFDAIGLGVSLLDLNDVVLSAPFGVSISIDGIIDASVTVSAPANVPLPATPWLLLSVLPWAWRRRAATRG